jgi:3-phosphoshikimate 1-carboxyvinyltransferase
MSEKIINLFPKGIIQIPPSKSVTHRAIICASLANEESVITNLSDSEDISATIECMKKLGSCYIKNNDEAIIKGGLCLKENLLDCIESGSTLRFLIPIALILQNEILFTGQGRLMERPLSIFTNELEKHGAAFTISDKILKVKGPINPGIYTLPGDISSQFISGLLLSLPLLHGDSVIRITTPLQSASYVELTLDIIKKFGIRVENKNYKEFIIPGNQHYTARKFMIEGDYSQAAFFLVASALGCSCECIGLDKYSLQGDKKIIDILKKCGVVIIETKNGGLIAKSEHLSAIEIDVSDIPDLVPPLAALLSFCKGTSKILNAGRLRFKESDRLHTIARELNKIGANITEHSDSLVIKGVQSFTGGHVESNGDHRIAMMLGVSSIKSKAPVILKDYECVSKSYPNFWQDFEKSEVTQNGECMG